MLYCKPCKVKVAGVHSRCPLCGGNLAGSRRKSGATRRCRRAAAAPSG